MQLISNIDVRDGDKVRRIGLYHGDLTEIPPEHAVDILIVSAFPDDYTPTDSSLIGALDQVGLSISTLSRNKAFDLRLTSGFWLSRPLESRYYRLNIGRVLCFEPSIIGDPPGMVGKLFRGLFPFLTDDRDAIIAMPLVAVGDQGWAASKIIPPLLEAAVKWFGRGLPVQELKIVERSPESLERLRMEFDRFAGNYDEFADCSETDLSDDKRDYDLFISYSIKDQIAAEHFGRSLRAQRQETKLFDFRHSIDKVVSYQEEIDKAIENCRRIIAILSPDYFDSPECTEEMMISRLRNKRAGGGVLLPIYWRDLDGDLSLWLQILNYSDCREADAARIAAAARREASQL